LYLTLLMVEIDKNRQAKGKDGHYQYTILAVEEPESHLHPHLQRLVFRDFLKSNMPILLSTHSPNIVSVSEPDWFLLLKKNVNGTKACSTSELSLLPEFLKRDLSRYLNSTRGEIVFSKGVILVEGDAEGFLIPAFSEEMKKEAHIPYTLDGAGISICNVSGTDFEPYVHFFGPNGLNLPMAIITDGDKYVGLKQRAKSSVKNKSIEAKYKQILRKAISNDNLEEMRRTLEDIGQGWYEGLNRGIKLAKYFDREKSEELRKLYDIQQWDEVRKGLNNLGIFVNEQTLEADLIDIGYRDELIAVYKELGATARKQANLGTYIDNSQVEKIINRIEETGKGKGRFAQRLSDKVTANKVPEYIKGAIEFVVSQMPTPSLEKT
jgi:putative ATP-dependent endonuclease of the OLD family